MGAMRSWILRPLQGLLGMFDLQIVRASSYRACLERQQVLVQKNRALEAQMAGFRQVMEQDYRLIHDLFHADQSLAVGD